mgnify:CR=1 FL=1
MKTLLVFSLVFSLVLTSTLFALPNLDVNRDTRVDWVDWLITCAVATGFSPVYVPEADVDGNGVVNLFDLQLIKVDPEEDLLPHDTDFLYLFKTKRFLGDFNNNGIVNVVDAVLLSKELSESVSDKIFDLNWDGKVDNIDLEKILTPRFGIKYFDIKTAKPAVPVSAIEAREAKKFVMAFFPQVIAPSQKQTTTWGSLKEVGR